MLCESSRSLSILPWAHSYGQVAELYNWLLFGGSIGFMESVETLAADMLKVKPTFLIAVPRVFNKIYDGIQTKMIETGGIYDKDPQTHEDAKLLSEVGYEQLLQLILENKNTKAGEYKPLDLVDLEILRRSKIKTVIVGSKLEDLEAVLRGEEVGTKVKWNDAT